jgi:HAD superfamily hydrolase (TIGR01509 family)
VADVVSAHPCRAVLFDLDGTLYRQKPLRALMAAELLTLPLAGPRKAARRLTALRAYRHAQEALRSTTSAGLAAEQINVAATASGLPVEEVDALVTEWMLQRPLKYLQFCRAPGLIPVLDALAAKGLRLGVFSDYPALAKIEALGLGRRFSPVLCSTDAEIAAFKPHPRGFLRACELWGLSPSDVLFVGDRPEVDAAGAAAAGMRCVIVGRSEAPAGANYAVVPTFERFSRVFDGC